jgi:hypothetical protein
MVWDHELRSAAEGFADGHRVEVGHTPMKERANRFAEGIISSCGRSNRLTSYWQNPKAAFPCKKSMGSAPDGVNFRFAGTQTKVRPHTGLYTIDLTSPMSSNA